MQVIAIKIILINLFFQSKMLIHTFMFFQLKKINFFVSPSEYFLILLYGESVKGFNDKIYSCKKRFRKINIFYIF